MLEIQTSAATTPRPRLRSEAQNKDWPTSHDPDPRSTQTSLLHRQTLTSSNCSRRKCYCACHSLQVISGRFWTLGYPAQSLFGSCDLNSCANYKHASLWITLTWIGLPYAIQASLDILMSANTTSIAPSLEVKRVVSWDAPAFKAIRDIRWNGVDFQEARASIACMFSTGKASPVDILANGETLLEVSTCSFDWVFRSLSLTFLQALLSLPWPNGDTQQKLLEFLVYSGADINNAR